MISKPIALTCGEPSGIGGELALKAWQDLRQDLVFYWIGDPQHLPNSAQICEINVPSDAQNAMAKGLPVLAHSFPKPVTFGEPDLQNAADVIKVIERAVSHVSNGEAAAVCTLPIHKQVLQDGAGFSFPGHTEYLAALGKVSLPVMMLASPVLKVVPATIHIPLSEVPKLLNKARLSEIIEITHHALRKQFKITHPRISVTGLNPHAGEGGKFGSEDLDVIAPVIEEFKQRGMSISGPYSADTLFHERARQTYDAVIAMYHDQALIPIKTLDFDRGVNVTLGLPFVRTSPDHGTALDIAGRGLANPTSTIHALRMAQQMAQA